SPSSSSFAKPAPCTAPGVTSSPALQLLPLSPPIVADPDRLIAGEALVKPKPRAVIRTSRHACNEFTRERTRPQPTSIADHSSVFAAENMARKRCSSSSLSL
ncbi:unnamed protein product, partial [Ectocarpus sp. 12 AP-2014]